MTATNYRAATALDLSLDAATHNRGITTDLARSALAAHLDGANILKTVDVRRFCQYLEMIR